MAYLDKEHTFNYCLLTEPSYVWVSNSTVYSAPEIEQIFEYSLLPYVEFFKNYYYSINAFGYNIRSAVTEIEQIFRYSITEKTWVERQQTFHFNLLHDDGTVGGIIPSVLSQYDVQIFLDGEDVTGKVSNCSINYSKGNFTGECTLKFADPSFYPRLDCSNIPANYNQERIEVRTKLIGQTDWIVQGKFFIEKRDTSVAFDGGTQPTCWGRTRTARLDRPYARPISKTWTEVTYARTVAEWIIAQADPTLVLRWEVMNYVIHQYRFEISGATPIEAIGQIASPLGAVVSTTKSGELLVHYQWVSE